MFFGEMRSRDRETKARHRDQARELQAEGLDRRVARAAVRRMSKAGEVVIDRHRKRIEVAPQGYGNVRPGALKICNAY
jgi:adenylate kinase